MENLKVSAEVSKTCEKLTEETSSASMMTYFKLMPGLRMKMLGR